MFMVMNMNLSEQLIEKYGEDYQIDRAIEEMSELTKALLKFRRYEDCWKYKDEFSKYRKDILEEWVDVGLSLTHIKTIFGFSEDEKGATIYLKSKKIQKELENERV